MWLTPCCGKFWVPGCLNRGLFWRPAPDPAQPCPASPVHAAPGIADRCVVLSSVSEVTQTRFPRPPSCARYPVRDTVALWGLPGGAGSSPSLSISDLFSAQKSGLSCLRRHAGPGFRSSAALRSGDACFLTRC